MKLIIPFCILFSGCVTTSSQTYETTSSEQEMNNEVKRHLDIYMYCVTDYAQSHAYMKSDAQSIAISAISECDLKYSTAKNKMIERLESMYPDEYKYRGRYKAEQTMENIRDAIYNKAVSLIVQKRG